MAVVFPVELAFGERNLDVRSHVEIMSKILEEYDKGFVERLPGSRLGTCSHR